MLAGQVTPPQVPPWASPRAPSPALETMLSQKTVARSTGKGLFNPQMPNKRERKSGEVRTAREPRGQGEPRPADMVEGSEGRAAGVRGQQGGDSGQEAEGRALRGKR